MFKLARDMAASARIEIVALFGTLLLIALHRTLRWERLGGADCTPWPGFPGPAIAVLWHCHQLMIGQEFGLMRARLGSKLRPRALISEHSDGRIIARVMRYMGIDSIAGSSSRGARRAFRELLRTLNNGGIIVITPDGPRGPARQAKAGIAELARHSSAPIVPIAYGAASFWRFNSWDGMILPKPFSKARFYVGEPFFVDTLEVAEALNIIEQHVNSAAARVESYECS